MRGGSVLSKPEIIQGKLNPPSLSHNRILMLAFSLETNIYVWAQQSILQNSNLGKNHRDLY